MPDTYWMTAGRVPSTLDVDPAFAALAGPEVSLLDMGCGDGRTLAGMDERVRGRGGAAPGARGPLWAGVDVNPPSLAAGRERGLPRTAFVRADLARDGYLPSFCTACYRLGRTGEHFMEIAKPGDIHQFCDPNAVLTTLDTPGARRAVLAEAARVLARGLTLSDFLLTPEVPLYRERYERGLRETGEWGTFRVMDGERYLYTAHHYTLEELETLLAEAGFSRIALGRVASRTRSGNLINGVRGMAFLD